MNKDTAPLLFMPIFIASSLAIIYYLVKASFFTNSDIFWIGAIAGFLGCLFLSSGAVILLLYLARGLTTKKNRPLLSILFLLALGVVVIYLYKGPFSLDSDVWWYGAIAGFLSSLALVFLSLSIFIAFKLKHKDKSAIQN
jgi:hypothetical protein